MFAPSLKKLCAALGMILMLSGCLSPQTALDRTEHEIFVQLNNTLPTASRRDTERTKREVGIHRKVFVDLCVGRGHCVVKAQ